MKNLEAHILEAREALDAALTEMIDGEAATPGERIIRRDMIRTNRHILQQLHHMLSDARQLDR